MKATDIPSSTRCVNIHNAMMKGTIPVMDGPAVGTARAVNAVSRSVCRNVFAGSGSGLMGRGQENDAR